VGIAVEQVAVDAGVQLLIPAGAAQARPEVTRFPALFVYKSVTLIDQRDIHQRDIRQREMDPFELRWP
jgi:hypothetical protein